MTTRTYVETAEPPDYDYYGFEPWFFACCADCDWQGPGRIEWRQADGDRRRHPRALCWLARKARLVREDGWRALLWA